MVSSQSVSKAVQSLLISFALANFPDLVSADPPYYNCSANTIYGVSSLFQSNLENLLDSLLLKASVSHFNNTSIGNGSDRVTGAFLCLNYITDDRCIPCISEAANNVKKFCPDMSEAVIWEEDCQMLYSNETLFGRLSTEGNNALNNKKNVSDLESEQLRFRSVVNDTLQNLTKQAAFNSSTGMYATKPVVFTDIDTLYAFVQCTPDLSPDNCSICLQTAITDVLAVYFSRGARLLSRSCYLRYEFYPFYEGATEPLAPFSPQSPGTRKDGRRKIGIIISVSVSLAVATLAFFVYYLAARSTKKKESTQHLFPEVQLPDICEPSDTGLYQFLGRKSLNCQEFPFIDLATIHEATNHFSESNKLGQGGFGPVYKGLLPDGKEVAVKRLSSDSDQGLEEFTNEVLLIMKLQHKNLVRLLGFCVDTEEKMLVYEYMPNSSLDVFLFDPRRRAQLDWRRRLNIIVGIARGILYLHEDSRLRIIHRDLKASNVLLDCDMNPKISDFGMARIIGGSEGEANTTTIVGTWGYMAPEYAMEGLYSVKSDVFSFGVLLLEIITGRRNAGPGFHLSKRAPSLLAFAWQLWNDGKGLELMDPLLAESCCPDEFLRCYHIGLLCIQEDAFDRPTMSSVVVMLKSKTVTLRQPERPAFSIGRFTDWDQRNACGNSVNGLTISSMGPR